MFWNKDKDETRNVRRTVWKPSPKPDLLNRASKNVSDKNKNTRNSFSNINSRNKTQRNINNEVDKNQTSEFASKSQVLEINHKKRISELIAGQNAAFNGNANPRKKHFESYKNSNNSMDDMSEEEAFSSSYSDIASVANKDRKINRTALKNQNDSTDSSFSSINDGGDGLKINNINDDDDAVDYGVMGFGDEPPKSVYTTLRTLAIIISLFVVVFCYFFEPWFWQNIRSINAASIVDKDVPVVVVVRQNEINKSGASEEEHFRAIERIFTAHPRVVGFYGSLSDWLPISNDPLQIARVNQLLLRYPNVVVSVDANINNSSGELSSYLSERNKINIKADDFANLNRIKLKDSPALLDIARSSFSIGYVLEEEVSKIANNNSQIQKMNLSNLATVSIMASLDEITKNNSAGFVDGVLSFPLMLAMIANGQKPQEITQGNTINGKLFLALGINLSTSKTGKYAPVVNVKGDFPISIEWHELIKKNRKDYLKLFKNRTVIIGMDDKVVYLPIAKGYDKSKQNSFIPLGLSKILNFGVGGNELESMVAVIWQAYVYSSIQAGLGFAAQNVITSGYIALLFTMLASLLLWFSKDNRRKLIIILTIIISTILFTVFSPYSFVSATIYGMLILPILLLINNRRGEYLKTMRHWEKFQLQLINQNNSEKPKLFSTTKSLSTIYNNTQIGKAPDIAKEKTVVDVNNGENVLIDEYFAEEKKKNQLSDSFKQDIFSDGPNSDSALTNEPSNINEYSSQIKHVANSLSQMPASPAENTNFFTKNSEDNMRAEVEEANNFVHKDDINLNASKQENWQDDWNWDEKEDIVKNVANDVLSGQELKELAQPVADTQLFNKALVEDIEDGEERDDIDDGKLKIGRYIVERVLGKGAMGVVYLGVDPHIERNVAIKTVPLPQEEIAGENIQLARKFFREAQAAGRLTHPGIVTIYDAGLFQNNVYMAMEFLEGQDLSHFVPVDKLLPLVTVLSIVARVAEALHFAHQNGVIHRDIKPANIIFNSTQNTVKVTDFGIAHIHDSNRAMTQVLVGSPNYMSPEHLTGEALDGRSDLFSLAVTLYVLCCGTTPFFADNVSRLMYCIINEPPRDVRKFNPKVPDNIVQILNKALAKDREQRYNSGASMAQDLLYALKQILNHV